MGSRSEELSIAGKIIQLVFEFTRTFISEDEANQICQLSGGLKQKPGTKGYHDVKEFYEDKTVPE